MSHWYHSSVIVSVGEMNWPLVFWLCERLALVALGVYCTWLFWPAVVAGSTRKRRQSDGVPLQRSHVRRVARECLGKLGLGLARTPSPLKNE